MKGPAPTGLLLKSAAPCFWMAVGEPMKAMSTTACGNTEFFDFNVIFSVWASTTSIVLMRLAWAARDALLLGSFSRSQLNFTASALYGVPSLNLMLAFSL